MNTRRRAMLCPKSLATIPLECRQCILGFSVLRSIFPLLLADRATRLSLRGLCRVLQLCLEPAGGDDDTAVVDSWHRSLCCSGPPASFLEQRWRREAISAKVAVETDAFRDACRELLENSSPTALLSCARAALGCAAWLAEDIRVDRLVALFVPSPVPANGLLGLAAALPCTDRGLSLGLSNFELASAIGDWAGAAAARREGKLRLLKPHQDFAGPLVTRSRLEESESEGMELEDAGSRREVLAALPAIDGLFEDRLALEELGALGDRARSSLKRLGCLSVRHWAELNIEVRPCPEVRQVALRMWNFRAGTEAWPVLRHLQGEHRTAGAEALAQKLVRLFPKAERAHVFFSFDDCTLEMPSRLATELMEAFLQGWRSRLPRHLEVTIDLGICGLHFDDLGAVARLSAGEMRRDAINLFIGHLREELLACAQRKEALAVERCGALSQGSSEADLRRHWDQEQSELDRRTVPRIRATLARLLGQGEADSIIARTLGEVRLL